MDFWMLLDILCGEGEVMNFFTKLLNTDGFTQNIKPNLESKVANAGEKDTKGDELQKTPELKLIKTNKGKEIEKMKDGNSMQQKENVYLVKVDKHVNFEEIYTKSNIEKTDNSIELVINTTKKLAATLDNSPLNVLQVAVQTTLEATGKDLERIKQDGNNKITAVKKYKEAVENEISRSINETKNKIIELEKQIEQYKMEIQNKKNISQEINKKIDNKVKEIASAINFLNRDSGVEILLNDDKNDDI